MNKCIIDSSIECDIQMISLDKDFVAGDVVIPMGTPVPVQFTDKTMSQGSIGTESLAAGLIKVLADGCYTDRRKQYKALLLAIQPDSAKELTLAGIAQSQKANHAFAQTLFKAVIALTGSADAYINLALAYAKEVAELQKAGKIEEAEKVDSRLLNTLHKGLEANPDNPALLAELGGFHLRQNDLDLSYEYFSRFMDKAPDGEQKKQVKTLMESMTPTLSKKKAIEEGYDQIMLGNEEKAISIMEDYLKSEPSSWEGWFIKGWALRCQEKYAEATESLLKSIQLDSKNPEVYNELSICTRESGDTQLAKEYLAIANELESGNVIYLTNLAFLHLADKEFDQAREFLDLARLADPEDPQVVSLMQQYTELTGEAVGPAISQVVYEDEDLDELKKTNPEVGSLEDIDVNSHFDHHHHEEECGCCDEEE